MEEKPKFMGRLIARSRGCACGGQLVSAEEGQTQASTSTHKEGQEAACCPECCCC